MSQSPIEDDSTSKLNQSDSLSVFCREVRNLLRSKPNCMIPFSKFVPAYHNHYGRQCCVYQFGYTKLIELLESIPHVVQIVGDSTNRYITLTHREQIKRFASDLIKVVKSQPGKKLKLSQFSRAYEQVLGRSFKIEDYGTNNINVLLAEIWEGTINIMPIKREFADPNIIEPLFVESLASSSSSPRSSTFSLAAKNPILKQLVASNELINKPYITEQYPDAWFEIPKRERSEKEIKRTKYFVWDVIELLSKMEPDYSVPFSKFIPSYHYYFNRQCKVSIFGFSKLIDLFESISPEVVQIIDPGPGEEKIIRLADRHLPAHRGRAQKLGATPIGQHNNTSHHHNGHGHTHSHNNTTNSSNINSNSNSSTNINNNNNRIRSFLRNNSNKSPAKLSYNGEATDEFSSEEEGEADDVILAPPIIDRGPTEEELMELEGELKAYEELKAIQSKRSSRMAAILDFFKYSIY